MSAKLEISSILKHGLSKLLMLSNEEPSMGLKFVSDIDQESNNYVKLHILDAKKHNAVAVYFRFFEDRPPVPQIYIYEENKLEENYLKDLHKELWSSCKVPMFFIFSKTEIKIFNSLSKDINKDCIEPIGTIDLISKASDIKKEFQARMFDTGEFWNTDISKNFSYSQSAYECLLGSLKLARNALIEKNILPKNIINKLIIKSILIKYLEERKVFEDVYWKSFAENANSFIDVCEYKFNNKNDALIKLFDNLTKHFNGGIFQLTNEEKNKIRDANLTEFILFLKGNINIKTLQAHFWNLYSFKDLPIELISNIYELFLENKKGIVYTPSILVNFMIDEVMPLDAPSKNFKVIDPACGSGIFLVAAYKRHIHWWMIKNNFKKPDIYTLKSIIKDNIFGVDEKSEAVELAKFSLSLALCDTLSPEAIWNELHFDDLSKSGNLISDDFFNILDKKEYIECFDLVIGNPPFVSELTTPQSRVVENRSSQNNKKRPNLPDNQLSLLFLEQSFKLCKPNHYVCMIQPSVFLYGNLTQDFRSYLFDSYNVKQIIDFAGLNNTLFKRNSSGADVAVSVSFFQNNKPDMIDNEILHITVRQTFESKEKLYFDLNYYDFHWIDYREAINNKYIWKCNLLGGSRTVDIIKKLNLLPNLGSYLKKKRIESNWSFSEGYQEGTEINRVKDADFITGHKTLPPEAFTVNGIDNDKLYVVTDKKFQWTRERNKDIYKPPHLLIKKQISESKILSEYRDDYLTFKNTVFGIHAPEKEVTELKRLNNYLYENSSTLLFYLATTSSRALIYKATSLLQKDLLQLPYESDVTSSDIEKYFINDTLDYMIDWVKGKNELAVLCDVTENQIKQYQMIYCNLLNTMYNNYKPLSIVKTEQFIITSFYYKTKPKDYLKNDCDLDEKLDNLINEKTSTYLNIRKIFKIYDKNIVYIIKPKQLRYWLNSIAVRDADDTFVDLIEMRYNSNVGE